MCMQLLLYSQTAKSTSMHCSDYKYGKNCNGQMESNNCELIYATTQRYQVYLHIRTHKVNFDLHAPIFSEILIICNQFQHVTTLLTQHALSGFTIQAFTFWLFSGNKCLPFVVLCPNLTIHDAFYCLSIFYPLFFSLPHQT